MGRVGDRGDALGQFLVTEVRSLEVIAVLVPDEDLYAAVELASSISSRMSDGRASRMRSIHLLRR